MMCQGVKITVEDLREIVRLDGAGMMQRDIANHMGISDTTVSRWLSEVRRNGLLLTEEYVRTRCKVSAWTAEHDAALIAAVQRGDTPSATSNRMRRTVSWIVARARAMGHPFQRPWQKAVPDVLSGVSARREYRRVAALLGPDGYRTARLIRPVVQAAE